MAFTLARADAIYTVPFAAPALELVGSPPDLILGVYRTFAERYPGVPMGAFKTLGTNTLSEVGVLVTLLDGRLEITLRVDQFSVQATNLTTPEEVRFAQDCGVLMQAFVSGATAAPEGLVSFRLATWLRVDGGRAAVGKILARVGEPKRAIFDPKQIGAERIEHFSKVNFQNGAARWQLTVLAEYGSLQNTDLYVFRDYQFMPGGEIDTIEKRLGFVEMSSNAIFEWLGLGELKQE